MRVRTLLTFVLLGRRRRRRRRGRWRCLVAAAGGVRVGSADVSFVEGGMCGTYLLEVGVRHGGWLCV